MKLIPLVNYTLKVQEYVYQSKNFKRGCELLFSYTYLLTHKLEMWMFIPCGVDGSVLATPVDLLGEKEYELAKQRCLFDGFKVVTTYLDKPNPCYVISDGVEEITFHIGLYNFCKGVKFAKTIEDLQFINPTLTPLTIYELGIDV